ncbi:hypothetical protein [Actinoplanes sp. HUAS TT8]|uniref:hypothetical protein n=1 Tax=Actinoplanes sp. HUAS TT8 TaxID=3447453 RepID=UPI003F5251CE
MRRIITTSVLVTALIAALGGPAVAGAPTAGQLQGALLTAAETPAGYTLAGPPQTVTRAFGYGRACDPDGGDGPDRPEVPAVSRSYALDRLRSVRVTVAAPGWYLAAEFFRGWADQPVQCPDWIDTYGVHQDYTRLELPAVGDASTGIVTVISGQVGGSADVTRRPPSRDLSAVVVVGDLVELYQLDDATTADDARFMELVTAGGAKLVRVKDQLAVVQVRGRAVRRSA